MPSHRGSRARGHRMEDTGDYGRARSGRGDSARRRRGLVRFWPAMALLAVSLTSAWLVGEVNNGNAQDLTFTGEGTRTEAPQNLPGDENPDGQTANPGGQPGDARPEAIETE